METNIEKYPILIAEDNDEDYTALLRAFDKLNISNPIYRCADGDEALDFLYHEGEYAGSDSKKAPRPALILLDLNMPGTSGREILDNIKHNDVLKEIPVVVLTTSSDPTDIDSCYRDGANSYMVKPVDFERFLEAIQLLKNYWLDLVVLPVRDQ